MISYILRLSLLLAAVNTCAAGVEREPPLVKELPAGEESWGLLSLALPKTGDFFAVCSEVGLKSRVISIRDKNDRTALAFDPNDDERLLFSTTYGLFGWEWKDKAKPRDLLPNAKKVLDAPIETLAISPNGLHIAILDANQRVLLIETEGKTMKAKSITEIQKSQNVERSIKHGALSFSPDSSTIALTTGNEITLYDLKSRRVLRRLKGHADIVESMCFVNKDTLLSASWDNSCRLWTIQNGICKVIPLRTQPEFCPFVAVAPDGKRFVCAYANAIVIFSFPGQEEFKQIRGPKSGFTDIAFSLDGRFIITTGESPRVQFWDIDEGREVKKQ
jgi:WD40 repeat protein